MPELHVAGRWPRLQRRFLVLHGYAGVYSRCGSVAAHVLLRSLTRNTGKSWRSGGMLVKGNGVYAVDNSFADVLLRRRLALFTA